MASGHVNRTQRPNTWLHRPSLRREDSPCQLGAVHTWPLATLAAPPRYVGNWGTSGRVTEARVTHLRHGEHLVTATTTTPSLLGVLG